MPGAFGLPVKQVKAHAFMYTFRLWGPYKSNGLQRLRVIRPNWLFMKTWGCIVLSIVLLGGCTPGGGLSGYKFNTVALSDTPINLVTLNSAYDDYNSTAPWGGGDYPFCFSSSRNSQGKNFDFIFTYLNVSMSKIDGTSNIRQA